MYHYLFTNDLRISTLSESLRRAGYCFMTDTVPSAQENKNENNNMKTLGFYFNLTETSNCAAECAKGNIRRVVLNFIKKFQFPNPRTSESLTCATEDGITVAPMRVVVQVLYNMNMLYPGAAYLTREEIIDFIFYNSSVAKNKNINIIELINQIISYRKTSNLPDSVDTSVDNRQWKHEDRQIREMTKILTWSGCVSEDENQRLFIQHDNLTLENKAALFDILTYNKFWQPQTNADYNVNRQSYENYMDIQVVSEEYADSDAENVSAVEDIFSHNVYGIHIKEENTALSEENPHICIGWSDMGDLSDITTKDELRKRYDDTWPNSNAKSKGQNVGQVWRFVNETQIGDFVIFADENVCHIGRITSDYYFDSTLYDDQSPDYASTRKVEWLKKDILRSDLSQSIHSSLSTGMSYWGMNDYKSAIYDLLNGTYMKDEIITEEDIAVIVEDTKTNYTIDELGAILTKMYNGSGNKTTAIHMFGFKYGEVIEKNGYAATKIISATEVPDSYHVEVNKGTAMYRSVKENEYGVTFAKKQDLNTEVFNYFSTKGEAINKIFYGTPGCGKSFHIEHNILGKSKESKQYDGDYKKENIIRTTFYQDYSNTDFVGQILPKVVKGENGEKDTVEYIFNPGPFTLTLIRAISNPGKKVALVVEEINRGNAPAIFGDVFQLLDRDSDGISEYGIKNVGVLDYLNDYTFEVDGEKKKYIFDEIKIPGNMYIYATMNTSDQNVYTLDTAFVRRWDKEKIKNSFNGCSFAATKVPGIEYTWQEFVDSINKHIAKHLEDLQVNEDKQIGAFFVKESLLKANDPEKFAYKVFDYLWSDVAKLDHGIFFNHFDTLEALIEAYAKTGVSVFKTGIFDKKETPQIVEDDENNE